MASGQVSTGGTASLEALERGVAFAELPGWRILTVTGTDARTWLHDLVTADVEGIGPGEARRSLILTPTGRIRADLHVVADPDGILLLQAPDQHEAVDAILEPYVLSSDVRLLDRTGRWQLFVVLGDFAGDDHDRVSSPSVVGPGWSVLVDPDGARLLRTRLGRAGRTEVTDSELERWRIIRGAPRMGVDFGRESLPSEAGLEDTIDFTKGCFLGQESVAKVRNLGHPPRILLAVEADGPLPSGTPVLADGAAVGEITSATEHEGGTVGIARVRWGAAEASTLSTVTGPLRLRHRR